MTNEESSDGPRLSGPELGRLLKLIKGADSVELKLTVPASDQVATIRRLPLDPVEAQPRQVFFFDTPDLALNAVGVVVRARRIQGGRADTVVKLRPVDPGELSPSCGRTRRSRSRSTRCRAASSAPGRSRAGRPARMFVRPSAASSRIGRSSRETSGRSTRPTRRQASSSMPSCRSARRSSSRRSSRRRPSAARSSARCGSTRMGRGSSSSRRSAGPQRPSRSPPRSAPTSRSVASRSPGSSRPRRRPRSSSSPDSARQRRPEPSCSGLAVVAAERGSRMTDRREQLRAALGRVGVWSFALQANTADAERSAVRGYERLGYGATWFPESVGSKEAFAHAGLLLAAGTRIVVGTGIANIYARDPMAMANGARTLSEAYPGRFVLGDRRQPRAVRRGSRQRLRAPGRADDRVPRRHGGGDLGRAGAGRAAARPARCPRAEDAGARGGTDGRRAPVLRSRGAHGAGPAASRRRAPPRRGADGRPRHRRQLARARRRVRSPGGISPSRTTRTISVVSAGTTETSRAAAATASSTPSSSGAMPRRSWRACASISTPVPTTSASSSAHPTRRTSQWTATPSSGRRWATWAEASGIGRGGGVRGGPASACVVAYSTRTTR